MKICQFYSDSECGAQWPLAGQNIKQIYLAKFNNQCLADLGESGYRGEVCFRGESLIADIDNKYSNLGWHESTILTHLKLVRVPKWIKACVSKDKSWFVN